MASFHEPNFQNFIFGTPCKRVNSTVFCVKYKFYRWTLTHPNDNQAPTTSSISCVLEPISVKNLSRIWIMSRDFSNTQLFDK